MIERSPLVGPHVQVDRWFLGDRDFMLMEADFGDLFAAQRQWLSSYRLNVPPEEALPTVQQVLAAIVLWGTFLPNGTTTAWSLLLPRRQWRLFVAADSGEVRCISRWSPFEHEHRHHEPLMDCQTRRRGEPVTRSVFEPEEEDAVGIVRQFFRQSQQTPGRLFFDADAQRGQMLVALADKDEAWFASLEARDRADLLRHEELGHMARIGDAQPWLFDCGCTAERVRQAILGAVGIDPDTLFGEDHEVEVECPRCGREYVIERPGE